MLAAQSDPIVDECLSLLFEDAARVKDGTYTILKPCKDYSNLPRTEVSERKDLVDTVESMSKAKSRETTVSLPPRVVNTSVTTVTLPQSTATITSTTTTEILTVDKISVGCSEESPKACLPLCNKAKPIQSATEAIGQTPMLRLHKMEKLHNIDPNIELYAKLEFMSIGGSVKDRIGKQMIEDMSRTIKRGDYIIEASSGNTGIALSLMCAVKGLKMIVLMPHKMSSEKENTMVALGARVVRTRTSAAFNDPDSHISIAPVLAKLLNERSEQNNGARAYFIDQYSTHSNVEAHFYSTAEEIIQQLREITPPGESLLDYFVATAGTGGTFTGCSLRLKRDVPGVKCVAIDPEGSILHEAKFDSSEERNFYETEGIGYDFHPQTWRQNVADEFEIMNDYEGFRTARELIRHEGVMCGGSSGMSMAGALRIAKKLASKYPGNKKIRIVCILPDGLSRYLTKFVSDDWMLAHSMFEQGPSGHRSYASIQSYPKVVFRCGKNDGPTSPETVVIETMKLNKRYSGAGKIKDDLETMIRDKQVFMPFVCKKTKKLICIVSRSELELLCLAGKGDMALTETEFCDSSLLYFLPSCSQDQQGKDDVLKHAHCVLLSQFGEKKRRDPSIIIEPKVPDANFCHLDPVARRNYFMNLNWDDYEVYIITPAHVIPHMTKSSK